uniref:Uncharacterized protein n=1 Tax=Anguilla anguilla TaxID=7936 RepID=A0A0E9QCA2_ANGAN
MADLQEQGWLPLV